MTVADFDRLESDINFVPDVTEKDYACVHSALKTVNTQYNRMGYYYCQIMWVGVWVVSDACIGWRKVGIYRVIKMEGYLW